MRRERDTLWEVSTYKGSLGLAVGLEQSMKVFWLDVVAQIAHKKEALRNSIADFEFLVFDPQRLLAKSLLGLLRGLVGHTHNGHVLSRGLHDYAVHLSKLGKRRI